MNIVERIDACYPALTKKQKQVVDYMRNNLEIMCFNTLKEMSVNLGITEITILNTCKILGYTSFNEMKYEARKYMNTNRRRGHYQENGFYHTDISSEDLTDKEKLLTEICMEESELITEYFKRFNAKDYMRAAKLFYKYPKIVIAGRGASYLLCVRLSNGVSLAQKASRVINTELMEDVYAVLPDLDDKTLLVAIAFPDYYFVTEQVAEYGKKMGAKVLVITDSEKAKIAKDADELLLVPCTTRLSINTLSAPMALITMLSSAIEIEWNRGTRKKIGEQFSSLFES